MDDIFCRLLSLTSYITRQFIQLIEEIIFRDFSRCFKDEVTDHDEHLKPRRSSGYGLVSESCSSPSTHRKVTTSLDASEEKSETLKCQVPLSPGPEIAEGNYSYSGMCFIWKGLMLPVCCLRFGWRLASSLCRRFFCYIRCVQARVRSVISRVKIALHGSTDDIGWLQQAPWAAPVEDGSARFRVLLQSIRNGEHTLPDTFVYLLIPGLFSNHGPLYFVSAKKFFSKMGLACHIAKIHSEASVEHNALELKQYIEELYWGSGKRVMLLGHSKGGVDAAAALALYWSELKNKVGGLALVQSPYGGTPVASDMLREGQIADKETRRIMEFIICKLIKGDIRALEDLTYDKRKEFIQKHKLPDSIPIISFHSEASIAPGVIATMTHISHAELPWLPFPHFGSEDPAEAVQAARKVPVIVPVSAAMAICALHLQLRYGEKSDGLVTCRDAEVPGSVVVKPDKKLDHAWMVYSSWNKDSTGPDACEMCEALLTLLVEIGKGKRVK